MHVKKPDHPYFQHTKNEPDILSHARKKWGVKITVDFQSPCMMLVDSKNIYGDLRLQQKNFTLKTLHIPVF